MQLDTKLTSLPVYEALASEARLRMLELIQEREMNMKELAEALNLSTAMVTMHMRKLEQAGLVESRMKRKDGGTHKTSRLAVDTLQIQLATAEAIPARKLHETTVPVGHYTDYEVHPTCGIATDTHLIGQYDDPRYFLEPERVNAQILWFASGYVEYKIPNYLLPGQTATEVAFTLELGSEAPSVNANWPSDIQFHLNGTYLGYWTSPGDYGGDHRGRLTPEWWRSDINQFGLLKSLRVNSEGTYVDGQRISDVTIADLAAYRNQWVLRLAVDHREEHVGGLTLYGKGFGNYDQDIVCRVYYA